MKKKLILILSVAIVMSTVSLIFASNDKQDAREHITDLLYEYKDAYNLRDFKAIRGLYAKNAMIESFPCDSKEEIPISKFNEGLPRCSSIWVKGALKLRLFRITEFELLGNMCKARVLWDYRDNSGRGKFNPSFEFIKVDGKWKISRETYGRKVK